MSKRKWFMNKVNLEQQLQKMGSSVPLKVHVKNGVNRKINIPSLNV